MKTAPQIIAALTLFAGGCGALSGDYRSEAGGREGQVAVLIDSTLWNSFVGDTLRATIGGPILTLPSREPNFLLNPVHYTSQDALESIQDHRNVLIVGIIGDTTAYESRWLYHRLSAEVRDPILQGTPLIFGRSDEWRRRQEVHYVVARDNAELAQAIATFSNDLVYSYNLATRERMYRELFDIGRQRNLEEVLMEDHGFAVNVQHDYVVATDTANFVWLRRILTDTWRSLFVYYQERVDPTTLTPENVLLLRNALTKQYMEGSQGGVVEVVMTQPITVDTLDFKGRYGFEIRGLWEMVGEENGRRFQFGQGGAFVTYAFYDEPSARMYMIDGMLFAPGFPKREFLRQLEVIAYTFRTARDEALSAEG